MLLTIGDLYEDVLVRLTGDPIRGHDTTVRSARVRGGSAANVAAIDGEIGGTPRFVGQVGNDAIGRSLVDDLRSRGVEVLVRHVGGTGIVVTLLAGGSRSRLVDRGASRRLSTIDPNVLAGASQLYLAANAFVDDPLATAVDRLLGDVRDHRIAVTLGGPSQADLQTFGSDAFLALVAAVAPDSLVLNRAEHAALGLPARTGVPGAVHTIITAGRRPTVVVDHHDQARSVEVRPLEVRDHTGAGDGFLAGYLTSRRTGADAVSAVHAGHRVAASVLGQLGPTTTGGGS